MIVLWILLAVLLAILACLLLLILFGGVQIRIICQEKLRVVAGVWFLRFTLVSDEKKKKKEQKKQRLSDCKDPERALRRELKRRQKAAKKAEKKRLKAQKKAEKKAARKSRHAASGKKGSPNLKENLDMILALLKKLYERTHGRVKIRVRRMHILVGTDDAAKTAITYGVILQSASYILSFIENKFTHIAYREGDISISPDYVSGHMSADIDIAASIKIRHALRLGIAMLMAYLKESRAAKQKALLRTLNTPDKAPEREK